jgi:hypothetical protein
MDLRFAVFELVARDTALRALLVSYADRVEEPALEVPRTGFLALCWNEGDPVPAGCELLTARVHLPREHVREHPYLDFVLGRLRTSLTGDTARRSILARRLDTAPRTLVFDADTVFKTSRFVISPASVALDTTRSQDVLTAPNGR